MAEATPWYLGNDPGRMKAAIGDAQRMSKVITRAQRILLVTGPHIAEDVNPEPPSLSLARAIRKAHLVASPKTRRMIAGKKGIDVDAYMNVLEVMDRLRDPSWQGFDGKGRYDLVILLGMDYYYASQMFSLMKHFGLGVKTMSLDGHYQPNAHYSFPNLTSSRWREEIGKLASSLGGAG